MLILGLAGVAGAGKDTIADYLVRAYGFVKFAFSDRLYDEVQQAFGLENQDLLRDRSTKEVPSHLLALKKCSDHNFIRAVLAAGLEHNLDYPLSPRQVLQWWGTEYRRAQDPDYWLKANDAWLARLLSIGYPEHRPQHFVNTTCRFPNEQAWIHAKGGNVWHVRRAGYGAINGHVSEQPLPVLEGEREIWNNDTLDRLEIGVDLLMGTPARYVRVEPMDEVRNTETSDATT